MFHLHERETKNLIPKNRKGFFFPSPKRYKQQKKSQQKNTAIAKNFFLHTY